MAAELYPVIVVGGGASGMAAAITAAGILGPGKVLLLERGARAGRKLLAAGNGRCNLSNRFADVSRYHGADPGFVGPAFQRFPVEENLKFFERLGLLAVEEEEGKLYPMSLQAAAVLDVLRLALEEGGVNLLTGIDVLSVRPGKEGFSLLCKTEEGERLFRARKVVIACGGEASPGLGGCKGGYALLGSLGHRITPRLPAIVQLKADVKGVKGLSGSKFDARVTLLSGKRPVRTERGELLFTDYGVSGPPIMQLSGSAVRLMDKGKPAALSADFLPDWEEEAVREQLFRRKKLLRGRKLEDFMTGFVPKRLGQMALKAAGAAPLSREAGSLTHEEIGRTAALLKGFPLTLTGDNGMKNAQVTQGGAVTAEFHAGSMESKLVSGLYACGEVLDIDGDCGGFNLQWAWSSGRLAGESAAAGLRRGEE